MQAIHEISTCMLAGTGQCVGAKWRQKALLGRLGGDARQGRELLALLNAMDI